MPLVRRGKRREGLSRPHIYKLRFCYKGKRSLCVRLSDMHKEYRNSPVISLDIRNNRDKVLIGFGRSC